MIKAVGEIRKLNYGFDFINHEVKIKPLSRKGTNEIMKDSTY